MAAATIERLYKVTVDGNEAVRQLQKIAGSTQAVDSKLAAFGETVKKAGAALGAAFVVDRIVSGFQSVVDSMDKLVKASQEVGVAAENLQALRYAAEASGASAEELDKGLQKLSQGMQDIESGTTSAAKALRAMGVTGADTADQAFAKIADAFAEMPDGAQKTALAIDIFGKAGARLIPTLNAGREGLREFAKEARELGLVMSQEAIRAAEHFNDQMDMLANIGKATAQSFVTGMLPALQAIAAEMIDTTKGGDAMVKWGRLVGDVFIKVAEAVTLVVGGFRKVGTAIGVIVADIASGFEAGPVFAERWAAAMGEIDDETATTFEKLHKRLEDAQDAMRAFVGPMMPAEVAADRLAKKLAEEAAAAKEAAEAAREANDAWDEFIAQQDKIEQVGREVTASLEDEKQATVGLNAARAAMLNTDTKLAEAQQRQRDASRQATDIIDAQIKAQEDAQLVMQGMIELTRTGTEEQKKAAGAWLAHALEIKNAAPVMQEWIDTQAALSSGWERFLDTLASGSVTAAQAFKAMAQSIIADLLKIWSKKFILDMLANIFGSSTGGGGVSTEGGANVAVGGVFNEGTLTRFATGGILNQAVRLPMALMGEAGPEAVMPLRRGADGRLGVEAGGGSARALNVQIINQVAEAQVSARRDSSGDLQVLVEATKKSLAADVRRGGTDFSRAAEGAWRLSRGQAAPF
jgi:hypothetical protein